MGKIIFSVIILLFATYSYAENHQPIRIPLHVEKITLDPSKVQDLSSLWISRQLNCQLVRMTGGVLIMEAADEINYRSPTIIQISLKPNIYFNDHTLLTSDDVIATFNNLNKNRTVLRNIFGWIKEIKKNDKLHITIILKHPVPQFMKVLASPNYALYKKEFITAATKNPSLWNNPVGCGNYTIQTITKNEIRLAPINEGNPLIFYLLPNSQINANEIDKYDLIGLEVLGSSAKLEKFSKLNIFDPFQYYLFLNTRIKPWDNQKQRCALLAKLNFDNVTRVYGNEVVPANDFLPTGTTGYSSEADFLNAARTHYKHIPLANKSTFCTAYLQSSIEKEFRPTYLAAFQSLYPHATIKLINKSSDLANEFAKSGCDGMFIALKSNYLDAYEYLLTLSEDGINISGYKNKALIKKIQTSQQFEEVAIRANKYREIINQLQALCLVYPMFTRPYETVYVNKNLVLPNFGKGGINDYYLGNAKIKNS